jgi:hypothetical protein
LPGGGVPRQLAVGCGKTVGNYHVLEGNHPVLLFSCMTKE